MSMLPLLEEARRNLADARADDAAELLRWHLRPEPAWASDRGMRAQFSSIGRLLRGGEIVWAQIFMANTILNDPTDTRDSAATLVYSFDPMVLRHPEMLDPTIKRMWELRQARTSPVPMLQRLAETLANDYATYHALSLPDPVTGGLVVHATALAIYRAHLPGKMLAGGPIPTVTFRGRGQPMVLLPEHLWPKVMRERWQQAAQEEARLR